MSMLNNFLEMSVSREGAAAVYQVSGTQFYAGILDLLHQRRKRHPEKKVDSILSVALLALLCGLHTLEGYYLVRFPDPPTSQSGNQTRYDPPF